MNQLMKPYLNSFFVFTFNFLLLVFVNFVAPDSTINIIAFFLIIFGCLFSTFRYFGISLKKTILFSLFILAILVLQYFRQITVINISLIIILFYLGFRS